jgi:hypothetical protein
VHIWGTLPLLFRFLKDFVVPSKFAKTQSLVASPTRTLLYRRFVCVKYDLENRLSCCLSSMSEVTSNARGLRWFGVCSGTGVVNAEAFTMAGRALQ